MAPKIKITKDDIINTSIELIREGGEQSLNARAIASALNCSTQPIFSNFTSMEELEKETLKIIRKNMAILNLLGHIATKLRLQKSSTRTTEFLF